MSNVIELNTWRKSSDESFLFQREMGDKIIPVEFVYVGFDGELFGTEQIGAKYELASIEHLRQEIEEEKENIRRGFDKYGNEIYDNEIYPWGDDKFIVCKEGIFFWDWDCEDYEFFGQVRSYVRKKIVTLKKSAVINLGFEKLSLSPGESYLIDGEYISYEDGMYPVLMLAIKPRRGVPIAIPYNQEILTIDEKDLAVNF